MKLPINPLLYLVSTGLFAGSGLLFYQALTAPKGRPQQDISREAKEKEAEGHAKSPEEGKQEVYVGPFWQRFKDVNLTGKLPPEVEQKGPEEPVKPVAPPVIPLNEILNVLFISAHPGDTTVIVRYKPTANVQPPEPQTALLSESMPAALPAHPPAGAGPKDTVAPAPRHNPTGRPALPVPAPVDPKGPVHHVHLDQALWKPFETIRLVGISEDAMEAYFVREEAGKPRDEWKREGVLKTMEGIRPELIEALRQGGGKVDDKTVRAASQPTSQPGQESGWVEVAETKEVTPGVIHVSREDDEYYRENLSKVLEDLPLKEYVSPKGTTRGIQIRSAISDPRLQRLGMQAGDVLISINGEPTPYKSIAISVAKEQYNRGVRTFVAEVMRAGRRETITYVARK